MEAVNGLIKEQYAYSQVAKQREADEDLVKSLEKKIQRLHTEMEMERRLKIEAKKDQEETQEELDEVLNENESMKSMLTKTQQDKQLLEDEKRDFVEEYKSLIENQMGEEMEARIIEARNNDHHEFTREREASAMKTERYRFQCEKLQQQKDESDARMQRYVEELEKLRTELSENESYRQEDIGRLLEEKKSLRMELKAKKTHLQNLEIRNQELEDYISQKDREMRKLRRYTGYFGDNHQSHKFSWGSCSKLGEKEQNRSQEIADLQNKIAELEAALGEAEQIRIKESENCDHSRFEKKIKELEAEILMRDDLDTQSNALYDWKKIQHNKSSEEGRAIQKREGGMENSKAQIMAQEWFEKEHLPQNAELKELKERNMALQRRCEELELIGEKNNKKMQELGASKIAQEELIDSSIGELQRKRSLIAQSEHSSSESEILRDATVQLETDVVKATETVIQGTKEQVFWLEELTKEKLQLEKGLDELKQNLRNVECDKAKMAEQFKNQLKDLNEMIVQSNTKEIELKNEITDRDCEIKGLNDGLQTAKADFKLKELRFEIDLQELKQQLEEIRAQEKRSQTLNADLEPQLGEKHRKTDDNKLEKQEFDETVNERQSLESKVAELEESKLALEKRCQSLKKQLQDKQDACKYFEAKQQDLFTKLKNEQQKSRDLVEKQNETRIKTADSIATDDELSKKVSEYEAIIAEKEAVIKRNRATIAACEAKLVKSEEERRESEKNLGFTQKLFDRWSEEFHGLKADDNDMKLEYCKKSLHYGNTGRADYEKLKSKFEDLQEELKKMKERERKIQDHNYSMKKKVDASEILEKELRKQIKYQDNELNVMRNELREANLKFQTEQKEREVVKLQNKNWDELREIVEKGKIEAYENNKLLDEMEKEKEKILTEVRKLQSRVKELEQKNTALKKGKEGLRQKKKLIEKQLKRHNEVCSVLKRTEDDLGRAYEDIEVLVKEKKELVVKCKSLEVQIAKIAGEKNKEEMQGFKNFFFRFKNIT